VIGCLAERLLDHLVFVGCDVAGFSTSAKKADQWRDVTRAGGGGSVVVPYQLSDVGRKAETSLVRPTFGCGPQGRIKQHVGRLGHLDTIVDMHNLRNISEPARKRGRRVPMSASSLSVRPSGSLVAAVDGTPTRAQARTETASQHGERGSRGVVHTAAKRRFASRPRLEHLPHPPTEAALLLVKR